MITREFDTIAAISTPLGEGAIGIVRLSGTDSFAIAQKIFKGKNLSKVESHTLNYGHIVDPQNQEILDEVMLGAMRSPKTSRAKISLRLTPTAELRLRMKSCSWLSARALEWLSLVSLPSEPFSIGRVDLTQAEAVMDIIRAKN